ncbi:MAG: N-acetyl-gamma-glutamyl-phosphate reductase [Chloroflexota bacterium]
MPELSEKLSESTQKAFTLDTTQPSAAVNSSRVAGPISQVHGLDETQPSRTNNAIYPVGVYGATGYAGQVLISLLAKHPNVRIVFATSESSKERIEGLDLELIAAADAPLNQVEAVFLCLPNGPSGAMAAKVLEAGVRVVDFSADLRLDSTDVYKQWYKQDHPAPQLIPTPYGLPEINRANLANAKVIANPGCHVTATLLALYPLAKAGALTTDPIIADTKTGISGAGKALKLSSMFVEVYGDVQPYNAGRKHRHVPEIEQELHKLQADAGPLVFVPHVVPVDVGLLATVYVRVKPSWTMERVRKAFEAAYTAEPLVDLLPEGELAHFKNAAHKNNAAVAITEGVDNMLIITSVIDNLRKGAASQAVQNFNLMMGLPETTGLL